MEEVFVEDKTFDKIDFTHAALAKGEYEHCTFINCDFSNADFSGMNFSDCHFSGCNLNMVNLAKTAFRDVTFKDSKMLGLHFGNCNPFGFAATFNNCILNHSSFYHTKMKKTNFTDCTLREVDFTACDLSGSAFTNCDLASARFDNSNLEKVDFSTAFNYSIDLEMNKFKKAKFSREGIAGLLDKYDIEIS